jgi:CheY-like chemotaxis protein
MVDLNESVKNTTKMLSRLIGENITLLNKTSLNMKEISADPTQISQILINLVINARDAMPDGGQIIIETSMDELDEQAVKNYENLSPGEFAVISVKDTGVGMSKDIQKEIFDPFFTTKEKGKGTGLGLSTVFGIVKQHKGHIFVNSEIGKGSVFKVYLPCLKNEELKNDLEKEISDLKGNESILIVDDNPTPRKVAADSLITLGYNIYYASSGEEALSLFDDSNFKVDLVLTDIVMPGIDGRELADRLIEKRPGIKIILMSGYSSSENEKDKNAGYDYIQKPFTPKFIMNYVRKVLNRKTSLS